MGFYIFRLDKLVIKRQRGNISDDDVVSFTVFVNQLDRGHGSGTFLSLFTGTTASIEDRTEDGLLAYPAKNRLNMSANWRAGPFEIMPSDNVSVVYTGFNTSDEQLSSLGTQTQDELELKVLDYVAKKFVELIAGVGFGSEIGSALSDAFDKAFKDPVGAFIGYKQQGPCNGPVFSGAVPLTGSELDQLNYTPLPSNQNSSPPLPSYSASPSFIHSYTDAATHDTNICGQIAETDVVFSVLKVSFISVRWSITDRFPSGYRHGTGLRQYGKPATAISIKSLLGLRP